MDDGDSLSRHEGDRFGVWRAKICRTDTGKAGSVDGRRGFRLADTERGGSVSAVGFRAWQTREEAVRCLQWDLGRGRHGEGRFGVCRGFRGVADTGRGGLVSAGKGCFR